LFVLDSLQVQGMDAFTNSETTIGCQTAVWRKKFVGMT